MNIWWTGALRELKSQNENSGSGRYERAHGISAGHINWCEDVISELKICAILDDSSRKILAICNHQHGKWDHSCRTSNSGVWTDISTSWTDYGSWEWVWWVDESFMVADLKIYEKFYRDCTAHYLSVPHHAILSKKTFQTNPEKNMAIEHHYGPKVSLIHIKYAGNRKKAFIA